MTVAIVVLLEVVDVEINASPLSFRLRLALPRYRVQIAPVVAPRERIADTQLQQLRLQLLPMGDVDQNSVAILLPGFRIDRQESAVDDSSRLPIATRQLELYVPHRTFALQRRHLAGAYLWSHEITGAIPPQLLQ